jgi:ketosteroid isomerase-like protein
MLVASACVVLFVAPGSAGAVAGATSEDATDEAQPVAEAMRLDQNWVQRYNDRKWDDLGALYAEDAIAVPPNHEPVQGRAAIVEYYKGLRDSLGEMEGGTETFRGAASGKLVSLVAKYSAYSGRVRFVGHELFERQPDGSLKCTVDMVGFRDPQM